MRTLMTVLLSIAATSSFASCVGSSNLHTCNDGGGFSGTTNTPGHNAQTASLWSQPVHPVGVTTFQNGQANGNPWNQTIHGSPWGNTFSGSDSRGQRWLRLSEQFYPKK